MADSFAPTALQVSGSGDFQQIAHEQLSGSASRWIRMLAITLFLLGTSVYMALALTIGKFNPSLSQGGFQISVWEAAAGLATFPATIVLHELLHGLAMRQFGARPEYGVLPSQLMFSVSAPGYAFRRNACLVVEIAPLMVLSILATLGMFILQGTIWVPLLTLCAAMNAGGSAADVWMASRILRFSKTVYIVDERDGFKVLTGD